LAWLSAVEDGAKKSRRNVLIDRGMLIKMPPVESCGYILDWWHELGLSTSGVNGPEPLPFTELESWARVSGVELEPWEMGMVSKLSQQFCRQFHLSKEKNCESPYLAEVSADEMTAIRENAEDKIRSLF